MEEVALLVLRWLPMEEQPPRAMPLCRLPARDAEAKWYTAGKDPELASVCDDPEDGSDEADEEGEAYPAWVKKQQENAEKGEGIDEANGVRCLLL